eukprot:scaffold17139_cov123-Isochrysis_galbana.AAC.11
MPGGCPAVTAARWHRRRPEVPSATKPETEAPRQEPRGGAAVAASTGRGPHPDLDRPLLRR